MIRKLSFWHLAISMMAYGEYALSETKEAINGSGTMWCGSYLKMVESGDRVGPSVVNDWIQGFLSGANVQRYQDSSSGLREIPSNDSIDAYVKKFCSDHPLERVFAAAVALNNEI